MLKTLKEEMEKFKNLLDMKLYDGVQEYNRILESKVISKIEEIINYLNEKENNGK